MENIKMILDSKVGHKVEELYALIHSTQKGIATSGDPYLSLTLIDKTGTIDAKIWNVKQEQLETFVNGAILRIAGEVVSFRGRFQIKIGNATLKNTMDFAHFLPSAPMTRDAVIDEFYKYIFKIENDTLQRITHHLIEKHKEEFFQFPAASKNHHEYLNGLGYHTLSMLRLAESIAKQYDVINKDLLYAGVILHDLGKVIELSGPVATTYTTVGKLIGHITICVNEINATAIELGIDDEYLYLLQHMILAHHGKLEYGSPKEPMLLEAEVLNLIDNLDARIMMMEKALKEVEPGDFSTRVFALENRSFYKPVISNE